MISINALVVGHYKKKYMRRFTSTAPARGARAPNRATSNSYL